MISILIGAALSLLVSPNVFSEFSTVRQKIVRDPVVATDLQLRVPIPHSPELANLRTPFAAISRVHNTGTAPLQIQVVLDDITLCRAEIAPGASRRLDCAVSGPWAGAASHTAVFTGSASSFALEFFELASHYGALTPGPRDVIIGPSGLSSYRRAAVWRLLLLALLFGLTVESVRRRALPRVVRIVHLSVVSVVGLVVLVVTASALVSPYTVLLQDTFLERLLLITALPALAARAPKFFAIAREARHRPWVVNVATGVLVGAVFLAYAAYRIDERYRDNVSGLLLISHRFFDPSPQASRGDVRDSLHFDGGGGYDGQFFYLMTFDPFLSEFRNQPGRYGEFIDNPPYRYGRIGFSLLTKAISLNRPTVYPVVMVALVLVSLAVCALLLGRIAERNGLSGWYGGLILLVPGFWQSVEGTLPEPIAVAFFLGAFLCFLGQRWWACGALLGASMLIRETGGVLVLALMATLALRREYRHALIVGVLSFLPLLLWKAYVGSVFWADYGTESVFHAPENTGAPFGGVWTMLTAVQRGEYLSGTWEAARAAVSFAVLTTVAVILAVVAAIRKPTPVTIAACLYALLTVSYNYPGVWIHVGNAQRLTIDLFIALSLVFLQARPGHTALRRAFVLFWAAIVWYVFFGAFESADARESLTFYIAP